ncbi:MAG: preprotein translocase subunit YajC [Nitrosospira sp.]|nr:preprotein translocase subunit YajC [Nitrosospira sp.]MDW7642756.1 PP0621 family protein [Nitrosomonadaceae bacterium]MBI0407102.1 preprotein translocase subunit YajC [Nitrosospira sp.]MBI0415010.1 preprotein translocase subunit YajC [Nitrosospira sp.]MBI0415217.1 preprotein translocase subunit YajC [Nitrosospira sp.]
MGRLLFFIFIFVLVAWIIRRYIRGAKDPDKEPPSVTEEDMVQCAHCGVHLPKSESFIANDKFYCSEEHLHLDSRP